MIPEFEIEPLVGVRPVLLGMSRAEVMLKAAPLEKEFFKTKQSQYKTSIFYNQSFHVYYSGDSPTVEFIELMNYAGLKVRFKGLSIFETPAEQLIKTISAITPFKADDPGTPESYIFPAIQLSLWKPLDTDLVFRTVGIGRQGCYDKK